MTTKSHERSIIHYLDRASPKHLRAIVAHFHPNATQEHIVHALQMLQGEGAIKYSDEAGWSITDVGRATLTAGGEYA